MFSRVIGEALGARQNAQNSHDGLEYWRGYRDCLEAMTGKTAEEIDAWLDDAQARER